MGSIIRLRKALYRPARSGRTGSSGANFRTWTSFHQRSQPHPRNEGYDTMFLPEPSYSGGEGTKAIETLNNFEAHHRHAAMASRRIVHRFTVNLKFNFIHSARSGSSIGSIGGRTNSMPSIPIKSPKCQRFGKLMSSRRRKYFIYLPPVSEDQPKWLLVFRLKRHHSASRKLTR